MNSTITIGSKKFTFRIEIILLIILVIWILWGHLLCSCSNIRLAEGFQIVNSLIICLVFYSGNSILLL